MNCFPTTNNILPARSKHLEYVFSNCALPALHRMYATRQLTDGTARLLINDIIAARYNGDADCVQYTHLTCVEPHSDRGCSLGSMSPIHEKAGHMYARRLVSGRAQTVCKVCWDWRACVEVQQCKLPVLYSTSSVMLSSPGLSAILSYSRAIVGLGEYFNPKRRGTICGVRMAPFASPAGLAALRHNEHASTTRQTIPPPSFVYFIALISLADSKLLQLGGEFVSMVVAAKDLEKMRRRHTAADDMRQRQEG